MFRFRSALLTRKMLHYIARLQSLSLNVGMFVRDFEHVTSMLGQGAHQSLILSTARHSLGHVSPGYKSHLKGFCGL